MKKHKRAIFLISSVIFLTTMNSKEVNREGYKIVNENSYATYTGGRIYIGNKRYINGLKDINSNDVLVVDERYKKDSNMKVLDSYRINNGLNRREILKVLKKYEEDYPSNWNRTIESMLLEWEVHNIFYKLGYRLNRTTDVDFNNKDERVYALKGQ